mgnify:CR=1 FL=1
MLYSVYGIRYEAALSLIKRLKSSGIDAEITQGGIAITPVNMFQVNMMSEICKKYGTKASKGATPFEESIMMRSRESFA